MNNDPAPEPQSFGNLLGEEVTPLAGDTPLVLKRAPAITPGLLERRRAAEAEPARDDNRLSTSNIPAVDPHAELSFVRPGIQHGVFKRLRHGEYRIETRLDLHGMTVEQAREAVHRLVRDALKHDVRVCLVCSVHDPVAALDYAQQLRARIESLGDALFMVLRVYFEKPRTVVGWKGLINDPDLDGSFHINKGLRLARQVLLDVARTGLPAATEFLDTTFGQYYADLVSFGAIGARTVESQIHRELASGLSMPVGIKNRTDGDIPVAIDAIRAAAHPHWFPSLTKEGSPAILCSSGNESCCLILRGGSLSGPNFDAGSIVPALAMLREAKLPEALIVDCSHGNSAKDPARQALVARDLAAQIAAGQHGIRGVMIESHLVGGNQPIGPRAQLRYGQSITDACLSLEHTLPVLEDLAAAVRTRA